MKIIKVLFMTLLILFYNGCSSKKPSKIEVIKVTVPDVLLQVPIIDTNRTLKTDVDISLFMLDLYEGYQKCVINLEAIKRINDD